MERCSCIPVLECNPVNSEMLEASRAVKDPLFPPSGNLSPVGQFIACPVKGPEFGTSSMRCQQEADLTLSPRLGNRSRIGCDVPGLPVDTDDGMEQSLDARQRVTDLASQRDYHSGVGMP